MKKIIDKLIKNLCFIIIIFFIFFINAASLYSRDGIVLKGRVYSNVTKKPVVFGTVLVLETRSKASTDEDGNYQITLPGPGNYTIIVRSSGLKVFKRTITVNNDSSRNFYLDSLTVRGGALTIIGERDIQKVSRKTMTRQNLKEVPGTFGDSINALAALPGIIRTDGFFGPMVIRGADPGRNKYFMDDIPIYRPLHYGGLHSVVNNNIIQEIDLYASGFPAEFGSALSAVINITSVDDVKEAARYADLSLLSANMFLQQPILRDAVTPDGRKKEENAGYFIASGRYGYLGLIIPKMIDTNEMEVVPEYWDYQVKMKYYFTSRHSVTMLFMGSKDYLKFKKKKEEYPGEDPLVKSFQVKEDKMFNNQGLYYTYQPSKKFMNKLIAYSALQTSYEYADFPEESVQEYARNLHITSRPNIFGFKNKTKFEWWEDHAELRTSLEHTLYYFKAHGKTVIPKKSYEDIPDLSDPDLFLAYNIDEKVVNHVFGGYAENKFTFDGLTFMPGIRIDRLKRSKSTIVDPRGMVSYEFPTETTISAAGGAYSYYFQTNPYLFDENPDVCKISDKRLKPEKAYHRVLGLEQKIDLYTVKVEAFYNNFWNFGEAYPHTEPDGTYLPGLSSGKLRTRGFEIMLQKDKRENQGGLFGWLSYTYTRSKYKSGLPAEAGYGGVAENIASDPYGNTWIDYEYEQRHSLKFTVGYTFGNHTLSGKFQFYSSFPYTPITGSGEDTSYTSGDRYVPEYGERNSKHFDPHHTLDLRYSYKTNRSWGYVSFYLEVINVYNNIPKNYQKYDYRYPYSESNPEIVKEEDGLFIGMTPNFGVEVKF